MPLICLLCKIVSASEGRDGTQSSSLSPPKAGPASSGMSCPSSPGLAHLCFLGLPPTDRAASTSVLHMLTGDTVLTSRGNNSDGLGLSLFLAQSNPELCAA